MILHVYGIEIRRTHVLHVRCKTRRQLVQQNQSAGALSLKLTVGQWASRSQWPRHKNISEAMRPNIGIARPLLAVPNPVQYINASSLSHSSHSPPPLHLPALQSPEPYLQILISSCSSWRPRFSPPHSRPASSPRPPPRTPRSPASFRCRCAPCWRRRSWRRRRGRGSSRPWPSQCRRSTVLRTWSRKKGRNSQRT